MCKEWAEFVKQIKLDEPHSSLTLSGFLMQFDAQIRNNKMVYQLSR